jgi:hypothetical protein
MMMRAGKAYEKAASYIGRYAALHARAFLRNSQYLMWLLPLYRGYRAGHHVVGRFGFA